MNKNQYEFEDMYPSGATLLAGSEFAEVLAVIAYTTDTIFDKFKYNRIEREGVNSANFDILYDEICQEVIGSFSPTFKERCSKFYTETFIVSIVAHAVKKELIKIKGSV